MNDLSSTPVTLLSTEVLAGQAVYSPRVLRMYDWVVLGVSNRLIWRCPTRHLERMYDENVTANHLDVGVGTGYFLDRCRFPTTSPRVALMDLNDNCLQAAADRIARFEPLQIRCNVLEPIPFDDAPFDSIGVNYLLHCLPGSISEKSVLFDHLRPLLAPRGVIFGSTLLAEGVERNLLARKLMARYNQDRIFCNAEDTLDGLRKSLDERFDRWDVKTVGSAAIFKAR